MAPRADCSSGSEGLMAIRTVRLRLDRARPRAPPDSAYAAA
jgi:hypothetical protein